MSKDTEIIKQLAQEIGAEIELRNADATVNRKVSEILQTQIGAMDAPAVFDGVSLAEVDFVEANKAVAIIDDNGSVKRLYINGADFERLPETLYELENLEVLFFHRNTFPQIPSGIKLLRRLRCLVVRHNQDIRELPAELASLPALVATSFVHLSNLSSPPAKIAEAGLASIRNYFQSIEQAADIDYLYEAKMVLVGRGFAGKTSLVRTLTNPDYRLEDDIDSTQGIDIKMWDFKMPLKRGDSFRFNIWDFGGRRNMTRRTSFLSPSEQYTYSLQRHDKRATIWTSITG